jgi:hypothetical protein
VGALRALARVPERNGIASMILARSILCADISKGSKKGS